MKKIIFGLFGLLLIGFLIFPVCAVENHFLVNITSLPEWYLIDYGVGNAAIVQNYSIKTPISMDPLQDWVLFGSNDGIYFITLSDELNQSFIHDIANNISISTPAPYRQYVLYLKNGFNISGQNMNVSLFATYVTPSSFIMTSLYGAALPTAFDWNNFINKWWIVAIGIGLILIGIKIPLFAIFGSIVNMVYLVENYTVYTQLEIIIIILTMLLGVFIVLTRMKRK